MRPREKKYTQKKKKNVAEFYATKDQKPFQICIPDPGPGWLRWLVRFLPVGRVGFFCAHTVRKNGNCRHGAIRPSSPALRHVPHPYSPARLSGCVKRLPPGWLDPIEVADLIQGRSASSAEEHHRPRETRARRATPSH